MTLNQCVFSPSMTNYDWKIRIVEIKQDYTIYSLIYNNSIMPDNITDGYSFQFDQDTNLWQQSCDMYGTPGYQTTECYTEINRHHSSNDTLALYIVISVSAVFSILVIIGLTLRFRRKQKLGPQHGDYVDYQKFGDFND